MKNGQVRAYSAIVREQSRSLNGGEVQRALSVNLCLVCHDAAKDPIYRKGLDYRALDNALHRKLLSFPGR